MAAATVCLVMMAIGSLLDGAHRPAPRSAQVLEADLHVHPFPGDGVLTIGALRREAERRGLDVIAITAHNNRVALDLSSAVVEAPGEVIVLPGQEVTAPGFHLVAVGIDRLIDWRLSVAEAIAAIHAQGGVAIAAHPVRFSWRDRDPATLAALDGAELAHPGRRTQAPADDEYLEFFETLRKVNPSAAPIGSSDYHTAAPLGLCRTYLLVDERSASGALAAIRLGRTVARSPNGDLYGAPADVAIVRSWLAGRDGVPAIPVAERTVALIALAALAGVVAPPLRRRR